MALGGDLNRVDDDEEVYHTWFLYKLIGPSIGTAQAFCRISAVATRPGACRSEARWAGRPTAPPPPPRRRIDFVQYCGCRAAPRTRVSVWLNRCEVGPCPKRIAKIENGKIHPQMGVYEERGPSMHWVSGLVEALEPSFLVGEKFVIGVKFVF